MFVHAVRKTGESRVSFIFKFFHQSNTGSIVTIGSQVLDKGEKLNITSSRQSAAGICSFTQRLQNR